MKIVTALFDIDRIYNDGRSIDNYSTWLKTLLGIFPDAIVFHDGSADGLLSSFSETQFIHTPMTELRFFGQIDKISQICSNYLKLGKTDLVYKNPLYGVVIMAKFELLSRALSLSTDREFLWVDSGVLRLYESCHNWKAEDFQMLADSDFKGALLEFNIWPQRGRILPKLPVVGSSERIIGTSVMLMDRETVTSLDAKIIQTAQDWINRGEWDTEQVAVAKLWKLGFNFSFYIQKWRTATSILAALRIKSLDFRSLPFLPGESNWTKIIRRLVN